MKEEKTGGRALKSKVQKLLVQNDWQKALNEIPERQAVNPLISLLCSGDVILKMRAASALGRITGRLAKKDMESARVVMRRLMWHLNDESGGIGWGVPEAMAEIMARHKELAGEYSKILVSYITDGHNFLEYVPLRRGAVWGVGRLAQANREIIKNAKKPLMDSLDSNDAHIRGFAANALGWLEDKGSVPALKRLVADEKEISAFEGNRLINKTVGSIAANAINKISQAHDIQKESG